MCLAVPLEVVEVSEDGQSGKVLMSGAPCDVAFAVLEDVKVGDHVLVHAGMAIQKLSREEAQETFDVFKEFFAVLDQEQAASAPEK